MKIAIVGYGKMGKTIERLARDQGHEITARMTSEHKGQWDLLKVADVAIEFTNPQSAPENILACHERNIPIVTGSTGWHEKLDEISAETKTRNGALLYASNFSIGVNIFMEINRQLAEYMNSQSQYDVELSETHHTQKLDTPSGTAITLAEDVLRKIDRKKSWVNQPSEKPEELSVTSHRTPEVPGTHEVIYQSDIDEIELIHRAKSRDGFAQGAIEAAQWLIGKKGVFTMQDVLNLNQRS